MGQESKKGEHMEELEKLLIDCCKELNLSISKLQLEQFFKYKELLLQWNEKINLTAITDEREIILKHFVDSITINANADVKGKHIIDVGTGAGFPGIPVKIMCPCNNMVLVDSLNKRINFIKEVINKLNIKDIECIHSRAEDAGRNIMFREKFDICITRAVANLAVLSEYTLPFVKIGGCLIALKGPQITEEINQAEKAISILGGEIEKIKKVDIPFTNLNHNIIFIKKLRQTNSKYPRKAGKITKNTIK